MHPHSSCPKRFLFLPCQGRPPTPGATRGSACTVGPGRCSLGVGSFKLAGAPSGYQNDSLMTQRVAQRGSSGAPAILVARWLCRPHFDEPGVLWLHLPEFSQRGLYVLPRSEPSLGHSRLLRHCSLPRPRPSPSGTGLCRHPVSPREWLRRRPLATHQDRGVIWVNGAG
jgi:hypothetical protein